MEYHEYANIYRMLPEKELQALADDMKAKGQLLHITSYEGKILDGRNRYRACEIAGIEPRIEPYTGDDPLGLIASLNDHRRHDTDNERALVGARMANLKRGDMGKGGLDRPMGRPKDQPAITIERAAELSGSSAKNIQRAKPIVQSGIPELQDMAESGEVSIRAASEVAKLPEEEQRKAVAGGVQGVKDAAKKPDSRKCSTTPCESFNGQGSLNSQNENTPGAKSKRTPNYIPSDGMDIWNVAKTHLDRILKNDTQREAALNKAIDYCRNRITNKK
jgi:hypothetical protein